LLAFFLNGANERMSLGTLTEEQIHKTVTDYLSRKFKVELEADVNERTDLFQEGLIDSFGFIELVTFLEKTFSIHFEDSEFATNSLNTIGNIVATVKRKIAS